MAGKHMVLRPLAIQNFIRRSECEQPFPHLRHKSTDDGGVDIAVGEEGGHWMSFLQQSTCRNKDVEAVLGLYTR